MDNKQTIITPPNSKESEMMVLGCMINNVDGLNVSIDALDDIDFFFDEHKIIFLFLKTAHKNEKVVDIHLLCEDLKRVDKLEDVGGAAYILTLSQYAVSFENIEQYVEEIKTLSLLRSLVQAGEKVMEGASSKQKDPWSIVLDFQETIKKIEEHGSGQDRFPIKCIADIGKNWFEAIPSTQKKCYSNITMSITKYKDSSPREMFAC